MDIGLKQKKVIEISKKLISEDKENSRKKDTISTLTYFALWGATPGFERIKFKLFGFKNFIKYFLSILKDILGLAYFKKMDILKNKKFDAKKYQNIIFSRSNYSNFDKKNNYEDRYFLINSKKERKVLFLLLHADKKKPNKIPKNVILLYIKKKN